MAAGGSVAPVPSWRDGITIWSTVVWVGLGILALTFTGLAVAACILAGRSDRRR